MIIVIAYGEVLLCILLFRIVKISSCDKVVVFFILVM